MKTLEQFEEGLENIPATAVWYLTDLGKSQGLQELFVKQSPQRLKVLREHALIESAVSSNRIEGIEAGSKRIGTIIFGKNKLKDRDEEEIRGYRNALNLIHEQGKNLPVSEETICRLHQMTRGEIWDAGKYKEKDGDIIEKYPDGRERIRFKPVSAKKTPAAMGQLISLWKDVLRETKIPPLIALSAFNLDFLCIHSFRDGNGRVSRLLLLLQLYHLGFEVGRYISIERLIEQNKDRYYETLEQSSQDWHDGKHNPWPYIHFILYIFKSAYKEFEQRAGDVKDTRGAKTDLVKSEINRTRGPFRVADLQRACPGVSLDLIRLVLKQLRASGQIKCLGRGQQAQWQKETDELGNIQSNG